MIRRADAHRLLLRSIRAAIEGEASLGETTSTPWSSATFSGMRHHIALDLCGDYAGTRATLLCLALETREFALPGHLVADIFCRTIAHGEATRITIEALTLEDV